MSNRRQNKLKKNPFVRFLRIVYRAFKIIVRKKPDPRILEEKRRVHEALNAQKALEARQKEIEEWHREQFITVGELLERVKWQLPQAKAVEVSIPPEYDVSLN